jgi:hypothetical protein
MTKVINSNEDQLPLADEAECKMRRALLIANGTIVPVGKVDIISKKDGSQVLSTRKTSKVWRAQLIDQGVIDPEPVYETFNIRRGCTSDEEGEYDPQPIRSEGEYARRKSNYLWMISDILRVRRELKLVLGKKSDDDPDWYF